MSELKSFLKRDSMPAAFCLGLLLHVIGQLALGLLAVLAYSCLEAAIYPALCLGWSQLVYMLPAILWSAAEGRRRAATMLTIMTAVAFIVTSACAVVVIGTFDAGG